MGAMQGVFEPDAASAPASLRAAAEAFWIWFSDKALPLWAGAGRDPAGGFHELLGQDGVAVPADRRARVQGRQAFVYAAAGSAGWTGAWRDAARDGLDYMQRRYRRADGLYRTLVSATGEALDDTPKLYDQAFVLLARAQLYAVDRDPADLDEARALRNAIQALRHTAGGFRENSDDAFQSNAHMHTLEAATAWVEAGGDAGWRALGDEIVDLALSRFIRDGKLFEFFEADWSAAAGDRGRIVEPGHQFEWSWLLSRWAALTGRRDAADAARALFTTGLAGIDAARGAAVDEMSDDLSVTRATARLWPQTEWLKAALRMAEVDGDWSHAEAALTALNRYLATPVPGLWWDLQDAEGQFRDQPAPGSSFYHIAAAALELRRVAGQIRA